MQALLVSTLAVAIAEIGDKTQLLALLLAARFRRPVPIIAGIFVATVLNHAAAAGLGAWVALWFSPQTLRWLVVGSFVAVAIWALIPDTLDDEDAKTDGRSAFIATVIAFFLAEMGDKTQIATVVLAASWTPLWQVVMGTTIGMLLANVPVVYLGARFAKRLPLHLARYIAAAVFAALALAIGLNWV